jgi:hypothetical protein
MRRGRIIFASIAAAISALAVAPGALAAVAPGEICRDLADGTLNGTYTAGEIADYAAALASDPSVQGYCTPYTPQPPPTPPTPPQTPPPAPPVPPTGGGAGPTPPTGGVLPGVSPTVTPTAPTKGTLGTTKTLAQTKATGTLPFTGTELTIFAIVGLALLGTGFLLRSTARQRS